MTICEEKSGQSVFRMSATLSQHRREMGALKFGYSLYGLCLASDWEIPGLQQVSVTSPKLSLRTGDSSSFVDARSKLPLGPLNWFNRAVLPDGSEYLVWPSLFEFLISPDGRTVLARVLEQGNAEAFEVYLFGQVLSFVLIKQGIEPVHGTAVVVDGKAVALVGDCSYGKSTLAAAFMRAGFPLLTDDLLVTSVIDGTVMAHAGPPRIKLLPESAGTMPGEGIAGAKMNPFTNKFIVPVGGKLSYRNSAPLAAIYVLSDPSIQQNVSSIGKLSAHNGCIELLRNTFNNRVTEPARNAQLLTIFSDLARRVPVRSLAYPRNFSVLPEVIAAVIADVRAGVR
jgi:hypothetical protein